MSDLSFVRKFYSEKRLEKDNEMPTTTTSVGLEMTFSLNISVLVSLSTVNRQLSIQKNFNVMSRRLESPRWKLKHLIVRVVH